MTTDLSFCLRPWISVTSPQNTEPLIPNLHTFQYLRCQAEPLRTLRCQAEPLRNMSTNSPTSYVKSLHSHLERNHFTHVSRQRLRPRRGKRSGIWYCGPAILAPVGRTYTLLQALSLLAETDVLSFSNRIRGRSLVPQRKMSFSRNFSRLEAEVSQVFLEFAHHETEPFHCSSEAFEDSLCKLPLHGGVQTRSLY